MISISVCWPVADHVKSPGSLNSSTCLSPPPPPPPSTIRRTIAIVLARNRDRVGVSLILETNSRNSGNGGKERGWIIYRWIWLRYLGRQIIPWAARACAREEAGAWFIGRSLFHEWEVGERVVTRRVANDPCADGEKRAWRIIKEEDKI